MRNDDPRLEMVELLRTSDPVRAGLVRGLLEGRGIAAEAPGYQANVVMPHLQGAIPIVIRVPAAQHARARALVDEMEREVEEEPIPAENAPYREAAKRRPTAVSPRLKRIAVAVSLLLPGGGHFYVQRHALGVVVVIAYVLAAVAMHSEVPWSGYLLAVVWLGDLLGALDGCDASRGRPSVGARRFAPIASVAGIGVWSWLSLGPLLPFLADRPSAEWCRYRSTCYGHALDPCLLDAVNYGPLLGSPECAACVERASDEAVDMCAFVEHRCHACFE